MIARKDGQSDSDVDDQYQFIDHSIISDFDDNENDYKAKKFNGKRDQHKDSQKGIKSTQNLINLQQGLKACKEEGGFFNPYKAFDCLNDIVKQEDPDAYVPEVLI